MGKALFLLVTPTSTFMVAVASPLCSDVQSDKVDYPIPLATNTLTILVAHCLVSHSFLASRRSADKDFLAACWDDHLLARLILSHAVVCYFRLVRLSFLCPFSTFYSSRDVVVVKHVVDERPSRLNSNG